MLNKNLEVGIHSWILELAKGTITEEMEEVKQMQAQGDECGSKRGRENIIREQGCTAEPRERLRPCGAVRGTLEPTRRA